MSSYNKETNELIIRSLFYGVDTFSSIAKMLHLFHVHTLSNLKEQTARCCKWIYFFKFNLREKRKPKLKKSNLK